MESKASTSPVTKTSTAPVVHEMHKKPTAVMPEHKKPTAVMPAAMPEHKKPMEVHEVKKWCHDHKYRYVMVQTKDGWCCDGFVEHIDDEHVYLAVPYCGEYDYHRGFVPFAPFAPSPFFPRRRFIRRVFPLTALVAFSLLPFFW
ncbi:hypothetical protein [Paenibacillus humicola]|uniref:hypothetical protein n=1 Tax=Paenibacillus humicola TaxID=3110540 RepID=UPI00237A63F6|nr:hypothetical protein [Paenibacillus humicola]